MPARKPFDLLAEFGKFGLEHGLSLRDPETLAAFGTHVAAAVGGAVSDHNLLNGQRVEAMFEALVVSLGGFTLLKPEDGGRVFPADRYRVADFRIVLEDGAQWLVEVKNVFIAEPRDQQRRLMTPDYLRKAQAYADATRAELKLAVYWAQWGIWTLVTPQHFLDANGAVVIDMLTAVRRSEFGILGDRLIGTRPPLRLRLHMDPNKTSSIDSDGMVQCVIRRAALFCDDEEITDPVEQRVAWLLVQHGEWPGSEPIPIIDGDRLDAIEFRWEPEEQLNDGFEIIGTLSRMFARHFASETLRSGDVVQLRAPLRPGWFDPLSKKAEYRGKALPLWRFSMKPS